MLGELLGRPGGVKDGDGGEAHPGEEAVALGQGLGVALHRVQVLERCALGGEEAVLHPVDDLPHHVEVALQEEVVGLVDAPRRGVLHRHHPKLRLARLHRLKDLVKGGKAHGLRLGEDLEQGLLAVGPRRALEGDPHGSHGTRARLLEDRVRAM